MARWMADQANVLHGAIALHLAPLSQCAASTSERPRLAGSAPARTADLSASNDSSRIVTEQLLGERYQPVQQVRSIFGAPLGDY
jgi:hypothetical protein